MVSLYGAALHSRDERVRELLRAGVSSLGVEAVKAVVEPVREEGEGVLDAGGEAIRAGAGAKQACGGRQRGGAVAA